MANSSTSGNVFMKKCNSEIPVQLSGIIDVSGTLFFNSSTDSHITEFGNIKYEYKPPSITKIGDMKNLSIKKNNLSSKMGRKHQDNCLQQRKI